MLNETLVKNRRSSTKEKKKLTFPLENFFYHTNSKTHMKAVRGTTLKNVGSNVSPVLRIRDVLSQIPDPTIAPSRIRIPDPGGKKAPDPGSDLFFYTGY
jgi:hypothetical protein